MTTIRGFLNNTNKAINSLDSDVETAIKLLETELLDLNREDQLFKGIGTDGKIIGRYSRATEVITQGMTGPGFPKRAGEPFNFYDTGGVFKGLKYRFKNGDMLELYSTGSNADLVQARSKGKAFGLTIENKEKFNFKLLLPVLRGFIRRHYSS